MRLASPLLPMGWRFKKSSTSGANSLGGVFDHIMSGIGQAMHFGLWKEFEKNDPENEA